MPSRLHEQAVDILYQHIVGALDGDLIADAPCNECSSNHPVDLVRDAASVRRGPNVGGVFPDLALFNAENEPITFIEVVVSHAPERNVHLHAVEHGIQIFEFHLKADRKGFEEGIRRPALSEALTIKSRLEDLRTGQLHVDYHNMLCQRPRCSDCRKPLPLRTISIRATDCWKCKKSVKVAVGSKDLEDVYPGQFTAAEREFAEKQGVILRVRYSATAGGRYLANVCSACDQIQGDFFLYMDPHHDRFMLNLEERSDFGPCDSCAERECYSHGTYYDYDGDGNCPECRYEAERTPCHQYESRDCFYPNTCQAQGCYFLRRDNRCVHCGGPREEFRIVSDDKVVCPHCGTLQQACG